MQMQVPRRPMHKYRFDKGFAQKPFMMQLASISQVPPGPGPETPPPLSHTPRHTWCKGTEFSALNTDSGGGYTVPLAHSSLR